jgi:hypothetical protein
VAKLETIKDHEQAIVKALNDNGPYSHNIIRLTLSSADSKHGEQTAKDLIEKFKLVDHGW